MESSKGFFSLLTCFIHLLQQKIQANTRETWVGCKKHPEVDFFGEMKAGNKLCMMIFKQWERWAFFVI